MLRGLHKLCDKGHWNEAQEAIKSGNFDARDRGGYGDWSPLHLACRRDPPLYIIEYLVKLAPEVCLEADNYGKVPLHYAAERGDSLDVMEYLVLSLPDTVTSSDNEKRTPLQISLMGSNRESRQKRPTPCAKEIEILLGNKPNGEVLMNAPAYVADINGNLPLHTACDNIEEMDIETMKILVEANPKAAISQNNEGKTPIHLAFLKCFENPLTLDIVNVLLPKELASDICNIQDVDGFLPLHCACRNFASFEVLQFLLMYNPKAASTMCNIGHGGEMIYPIEILEEQRSSIINEDEIDELNFKSDLLLASFPHVKPYSMDQERLERLSTIIIHEAQSKGTLSIASLSLWQFLCTQTDTDCDSLYVSIVKNVVNALPSECVRDLASVEFEDSNGKTCTIYECAGPSCAAVLQPFFRFAKNTTIIPPTVSLPAQLKFFQGTSQQWSSICGQIECTVPTSIMLLPFKLNSRGMVSNEMEELADTVAAILSDVVIFACLGNQATNVSVTLDQVQSDEVLEFLAHDKPANLSGVVALCERAVNRTINAEKALATLLQTYVKEPEKAAKKIILDTVQEYVDIEACADVVKRAKDAELAFAALLSNMVDNPKSSAKRVVNEKFGDILDQNFCMSLTTEVPVLDIALEKLIQTFYHNPSEALSQILTSKVEELIDFYDASQDLYCYIVDEYTSKPLTHTSYKVADEHKFTTFTNLLPAIFLTLKAACAINIVEGISELVGLKVDQMNDNYWYRISQFHLESIHDHCIIGDFTMLQFSIDRLSEVDSDADIVPIASNYRRYLMDFVESTDKSKEFGGIHRLKFDERILWATADSEKQIMATKTSSIIEYIQNKQAEASKSVASSMETNGVKITDLTNVDSTSTEEIDTNSDENAEEPVSNSSVIETPEKPSNFVSTSRNVLIQRSPSPRKMPMSPSPKKVRTSNRNGRENVSFHPESHYTFSKFDNRASVPREIDPTPSLDESDVTSCVTHEDVENVNYKVNSSIDFRQNSSVSVSKKPESTLGGSNNAPIGFNSNGKKEKYLKRWGIKPQ